MGIELSAGTHDIELKYTAPGFWPGMLLTMAAWCVFVFLLISNKARNERKKKRKKLYKAPAAKGDDDGEQDSEYDSQAEDDDDFDEYEVAGPEDDDDFDEYEEADPEDDEDAELDREIALGNSILARMKEIKNENQS